MLGYTLCTLYTVGKACPIVYVCSLRSLCAWPRAALRNERTCDPVDWCWAHGQELVMGTRLGAENAFMCHVVQFAGVHAYLSITPPNPNAARECVCGGPGA